MNRNHALLLASTALGLLNPATSAAQSAQGADSAAVAPATSDDIVVTARRLNETSIQAPVILTAIGSAELERRALVSIDKIALTVPGLITGEGTNSAQGGSVSIRGISGSELNVFADQAVSFNLDGVSVARGNVRRFGAFDIQQVEVLKGPQALFFGKNSPGGIIAVKTADPTETLQGKISAGYEFNAREIVGDGYVSGPLGDKAGFRIAAYGRRMSGYLKDEIPAGSPGDPPRSRYPLEKEYAVRGTFTYEDGPFSARAKLTYGQLTGTSFQVQQLIACPLGSPQLGGFDDCKADDHIALPEAGSNFAGLPGFRDGFGYQDNKQALGSLELNYELSNSLKLSSITVYYFNSTEQGGNATAGTPFGFVIGASQDLRFHEFGEEVRLTSSFDGPLNFFVGGFYQKSDARYKLFVYLNTPPPLFLNGTDTKQKGEAYSIFGQLRFDVAPTLELAAGGRYSWENKDLPITRQGLPLADVTTVVDHASFKNFSPEVTLSWRPSSRLTVYGSYKRGFLSGGFNAGNTNLLTDVSYGQQTIRGFEGGIKMALANDTVRIDLAAYDYDVLGLQITRLDFINGIPFQSVINAGKAKNSGAEASITWRSPVNGLRLHSAIAYNDSHYVVFNSPCYVGQTTTTGCGPGLVQNLANTPLVRAPKWTLTGGFSYETPLGNGLKISLSSDINYRSSFLTDPANATYGRMPSFALLDASLRLGSESDSWEIALIGSNLTNRYYWIRSGDAPLSGSPATGTAPDGPGTLLADRQASVNRGRQVMVRTTLRF